MDAFPAFFPLKGRTVVVAGEGEAADAKARLFDGSPATVRRVDGSAGQRASAYAGAVLAFVALPAGQATGAAQAARAAGVPVNVVDRPELCDFTTPAIVDRGAVVAAVGTGGAAPVLAALLRSDLEVVWPEDLGARAALAGGLQAELRAALPDPRVRRAFLRDLLRGPAPDPDAARQRLAKFAAPEGRLVEVAAGGPVERLRLGELRALAQADLVVAEPGCDPAVLAFARRDAERRDDLDPTALAARLEAGALVVRCLARPTD